jgi:putative ABC transport system ATP-binding protein
MLAVEDIRKGFGTGGDAVRVLDGVSFGMDPGETVALRGESGSGKSTLLHIIGALERADAGRVVLDGQEVTALGEPAAARLRRGTVAVVFQQFNLIPSLNVAANIGFQARLAGLVPDVAGLAGRLGLEGQLGKYPEELSGGQQQRVAVARALAARPRLILADEPTGNLDEATGDAVLDLMLELAAEVGAGLMMVTHSLRLAARLGRELVLERGKVS